MMGIAPEQIVIIMEKLSELEQRLLILEDQFRTVIRKLQGES